MEKMIGNSSIKPNNIEKKSREEFRLSCTANRDLLPGDILSINDVAYNRPGIGIPPKDVNYLLGHRVSKFIKRGSILSIKDFQLDSDFNV